jgi:hypothetical protein
MLVLREIVWVLCYDVSCVCLCLCLCLCARRYVIHVSQLSRIGSA